MDDNYNRYIIDANDCPKWDAILTSFMCKGCEFYKGFEIYEGQRCVHCSYYQDITKKI